MYKEYGTVYKKEKGLNKKSEVCSSGEFLAFCLPVIFSSKKV